MIIDKLEKGPLSWEMIDTVWHDVAILVCNPEMDDCPIVFVNDRFLDHSGYEKSEVLGRNCRFMQGPNSEPSAKNQFRFLIAQRQTGSVVITNYTKSGQSFLNKVLITTIKDRTGHGSLVVSVQLKLDTQ